MQHGGDADAGAKVLGVGGNDDHRLGRRLEQQDAAQIPRCFAVRPRLPTAPAGVRLDRDLVLRAMAWQ